MGERGDKSYRRIPYYHCLHVSLVPLLPIAPFPYRLRSPIAYRLRLPPRSE